MTFVIILDKQNYIYDTVSGAVIPVDTLTGALCDAVLFEGYSGAMPERCPSEIRYDFAKFSSTRISEAYTTLLELSKRGLIYKNGGVSNIRIRGEFAASETY